MRVGAGVTLGIAMATGAVGLAACDDGAGATRRATTATTESPTYLPADLPGGFGANPVEFDRRLHGYSLTIRVHALGPTAD